MRKTTLESLRETVPPSHKVGYCDELNSIVLDFHLGAREEAGSPRNGVNWVTLAKRMLGRQSLTANLKYRTFIWEMEQFTLFVSNGKGVVVEVVPDLPPESTIEAVRQAYSLLRGTKE
jgi:hypothetical protein